MEYLCLTPKTRSCLQSVEKIAREVLPEGYRVVLSGSAQSFRESFQSLFFALWLGIIISYMVLASQFNSYKDPFVILLALPFSISGAFLALLIANRSLNVYSMIGLILLMGIVKKNSDGTYAIAKAPVVLKERGKGAVASAKPAKGEPKADKPKRAKGDDDHRSDDAKELHAAIRFFEEHPELLDMDRQLFAEALEHLENAELQGWKLVKQKDGSIHLVEAK